MFRAALDGAIDMRLLCSNIDNGYDGISKAS